LWSCDIISYGGLYKEGSHGSMPQLKTELSVGPDYSTGGHTKIKQVLATNVPLSQQRIDRIAPNVFDKNFTTFVLD